jgi:hypothetical protein
MNTLGAAAPLLLAMGGILVRIYGRNDHSVLCLADGPAGRI